MSEPGMGGGSNRWIPGLIETVQNPVDRVTNPYDTVAGAADAAALSFDEGVGGLTSFLKPNSKDTAGPGRSSIFDPSTANVNDPIHNAVGSYSYDAVRASGEAVSEATEGGASFLTDYYNDTTGGGPIGPTISAEIPWLKLGAVAGGIILLNSFGKGFGEGLTD